MSVYRVGYHNVAFHAALVGISDNVSVANHNGSTIWSAFDGDREDPLIIDTNHGSALVIDIIRGGGSGWNPDLGATPPRPVCLAFLKHNLVEAGVTLIQFDYQGATGMVRAMDIDGTDLIEEDVIFRGSFFTSLLPNTTNIRLTFSFSGGGGPAVDLSIGEIYVGVAEELIEDPMTHVPLSRLFAASILPTATGGRVVQDRGHRNAAIIAQFTHSTEALIDQLNNVADKQKGAARPFMLHTHRHTGDGAWKSSGFAGSTAGVGGRGGVYSVQIDMDRLSETETTDGIFQAYTWPLFRHMSEDEL